MKITFLGATETVTGSKYLLEDGGKKFMIDCGLFQGHKKLRLRNWNKMPVNPSDVDALLLTHAHLDHSGYIPLFVKNGFKGPIYCSEATFDLCQILLADSGHIQEEDAARANRYGYAKHKPALPLYTEEDARNTFGLFKPVEFGQVFALSEELSFSLHRAGHILGASFIRIEDTGGTSILFSGDIGRLKDPVMKSPAKIQDADYVVVESTYGNRLHDTRAPADELEDVIQDTIKNGGTVVIPAFAVGRSQAMLYYINKLKKEGRIPEIIPVYLDSPMAINASKLLCKHLDDHRINKKICKEVCNVAKYTRTVAESKAINGNPMPKIVISASGMATGGRVLHHLKNTIGDTRNTILLGGFQAAGTLGDRLARGEKKVKIHGQMWNVRARVEKLDNMSAHGDYQEILTWMENLNVPRKIFVVHGEPKAAVSMKDKIIEKFGWEAEVAQYLGSEEL